MAYSPLGPGQDLLDADRSKLLQQARWQRIDHYYKPEKCHVCHGLGRSNQPLPNKNVPGKNFGEFYRKCDQCQGLGYIPVWDPPVIQYFCSNNLCPQRFVIELAVVDVMKGLGGLVRAKKIDAINYTQDRECPYCHSRLKTGFKHFFWKWNKEEQRWVNYFSGGTIRRG